MAKKSRTPPPPRRVQAPKARSTPRAPADRRRWLYAGAAALSGVIALAIVLAIVLTRGGGDGNGDGGLRATLLEAGCTFQTFKNQGRNHTQNLEAKIKYNSNPPTSGTHYVQPIPWGIYPNEISQLQGVHNLEHGGVVVQYGSGVPEAQVTSIVDWVNADPNGMLVAPYARLGSRIALTAWTHLALCQRFDEDAFSAFRDAYRFEGPEAIPKELMNPGQ